jgi:outer membrane murein-binding lipoprotein Lpp
MTWLPTLLSAVIGSKTIMAILAAFVGGIGLYVAGGINRAKKDAAEQTEAKLAAAEDRLQMDREATEAERKARDLPDEAARKEAMRWARR